MSGPAFASGSSVSKKKMMKNRKKGTSSETSNATDGGRESPSALNEIVIENPMAKEAKDLEKATATAVDNLDRMVTLTKVVLRITGTWDTNKFLLILNVLALTALLVCLGLWSAGHDSEVYTSAVGLCSAMVLLSLALENLTAVLSDHFGKLDCHVLETMVHGAVFVPKALLMTFIWQFFTASNKERDLHHADEILCHEIVGSTIISLLVLIPVLCLRIAFYDWKEKKTNYVLEGLTSHVRGELCTSRLVGCAFLALVAPSLVTDTKSKTVVFCIINVARARTRLYIALGTILPVLIALTAGTAWLLNKRLMRTVEYHHENKTPFPAALVGIVLLPLLTDAAGLYHIFHAEHNRENAVHMIIHLIAAARNHLVFGAVFASFSSLVFNQQFLANGAFVFSLLSFLIIMTAVSFLHSRETPLNTGVALLLLFSGFLIVTLTMPEDASAWLALLSQGHEQSRHSPNSTLEVAGHHGNTSALSGAHSG